jgi:Protein of unknown function (DUF3298)
MFTICVYCALYYFQINFAFSNNLKLKIVKTNFQFLSISIFIIIISACKNEPVANEPVVIAHKNISKAHSDSDGKKRRNVYLKLAYPEVEKGSKEVIDSVRYFLMTFVSSSSGISKIIASPDSVMPNLIADFRSDYYSDTLTTERNIEFKEFVWYNTNKILTIKLDARVLYNGSSSTNNKSIIGNFNPATGRQIILDELITDKIGLKTLLEKKFREVKRASFAQGFEFTDAVPFKLPNNFGFTNEGILFHYNTYEVGPYTIGDTDITIPYNELERLMNFKKYL